MTKREVLDLLKSKGIELEISACGCCSSPFVKLVVDGVKIVDDADYNLDEQAATEEEEYLARRREHELRQNT